MQSLCRFYADFMQLSYMFMQSLYRFIAIFMQSDVGYMHNIRKTAQIVHKLIVHKLRNFMQLYAL
jgi:hypothetical protein